MFHGGREERVRGGDGAGWGEVARTRTPSLLPVHPSLPRQAGRQAGPGPGPGWQRVLFAATVKILLLDHDIQIQYTQVRRPHVSRGFELPVPAKTRPGPSSGLCNLKPARDFKTMRSCAALRLCVRLRLSPRPSRSASLRLPEAAAQTELQIARDVGGTPLAEGGQSNLKLPLVDLATSSLVLLY